MKLEIKLDCVCKVKLCDHVEDQLGDFLQDLYDDAFDEGWTYAFETIHKALIKGGNDAPSKLPAPPSRKSKAGKKGTAVRKRELTN